MTGRPKTTKQREVWLPKEMDTLLDQFIIHKETLYGKFSHNISKIEKKNIWIEITKAVHQEHPDCTGKMLKQ